jgi:cytochrome c2
MTDAPKPPADPKAPPADAPAPEAKAAPAPAAAKAAIPGGGFDETTKPKENRVNPAAPAAPKPPAKPAGPVVPPTEPHYDFGRLNTVFFWSSIACVAAFALMVLADSHPYWRTWKKYQHDFQKIQYQRAMADKAAEFKMLGESERKALQAKVDEANAELAKQKQAVDKAQQDFNTAKSVAAISERKFQDSKADDDAARYETEALTAEHGLNDRRTRMKRKELTEDDEKMQALSEQAKQDKLAQEAAETRLKAIKASLNEAESTAIKANSKLERLEANLQKFNPGTKGKLILASLEIPLLDFAAPPTAIKQLQLKDFYTDMNYQTTGSIDRCQTCHLAADRPGFEFELDDKGETVKDANGKPKPMPQPFRTHPNLELYLGSSSAHKLEEFGCISCHAGNGLGTEFSSAAHVPRGNEQAREWKEKYNWSPSRFWETPMLPLQNTSAKCASCHAGQSTLVTKAGTLESNNWTAGRDLFDKYGCWGCHKTAGYDNLRKVGPDLAHLSAKLQKDWVVKWADDPFAFRHNTRMPAFFHQPNNGGPELTPEEEKRAATDPLLKKRADEHRRTHAELNAIVDYLYAKSTPRDLPKPAIASGNAESGKALFYKLGCAGCHTLAADERAAKRDDWRGPYGRNFGPSLDGVGSKTTYDFLYAWVKNPRAYWPDSRMPDLRLSDSEAADIASWLATLKNEAFEKLPAIKHDDEAIREQLKAYYQAKEPEERAESRVAAMTPEQRQLELGQKMLNRYGCYGCHNIPGYETTPGVAVELYGDSNEGSKPYERLDFGFIANEKGEIPESDKPDLIYDQFGKFQGVNEDTTVEVPANFPLYGRDGQRKLAVLRVGHNLHDWVKQKLLEPRIWDLGRDRGVDERTKMPNFHFTDAEAEALATQVMSFTKPLIAPQRVLRPQGADLLAEQARRYIKDRNCTGCHVYNGKAGLLNGAIRQVFPEKADPLNPLQWPPFLTGEGAKVQTEWLHAFLASPTMIRPKIRVRMPTFHFSEGELNTLIAGWNYESKQPFPFADAYNPADHAEQAKAGQVLFDSLKCVACHMKSEADLSKEGINAPNFANVSRRLKPEWINLWIKDPQKLAKGTNMPTFDWKHLSAEDADDARKAKGLAPLTDAEAQARIEAIKSYVMTIGK